MVSVIEDCISTTYIMMRCSNLCSFITTPRAGRINLSLKMLKNGLLKRQRQRMSRCLAYHSNASVPSKTVISRWSQFAMRSTTRDIMYGAYDSSPKHLMAKMAIRGRKISRNSPIICLTVSRFLARSAGTGTLVTSCIFLPLCNV